MCNHWGKKEEAIEAWLAVVMRLEPQTWHSLPCIATVYYSCTTSVVSGFGIALILKMSVLTWPERRCPRQPGCMSRREIHVKTCSGERSIYELDTINLAFELSTVGPVDPVQWTAVVCPEDITHSKRSSISRYRSKCRTAVRNHSSLTVIEGLKSS